MELFKALLTSLGSAAIVTAGIVLIAKPLTELARRLLEPRPHQPYVPTVRSARG